MAVAEQLVSARLEAARGLRMLHLEHPERPGEAWCGAEVVGVRQIGGAIDCNVCLDLHAAQRERRRWSS